MGSSKGVWCARPPFKSLDPDDPSNTVSNGCIVQCLCSSLVFVLHLLIVSNTCYSAHVYARPTAEAFRYMARTKQRRTYLPYTFPAVAGTHLLTPKGWRVEETQAQSAKSNWSTVATRPPAASGTGTPNSRSLVQHANHRLSLILNLTSASAGRRGLVRHTGTSAPDHVDIRTPKQRRYR